MRNIVLYLVLGSLAAVMAALFFGLFTFLKGGTWNEKHGNEAMRLRVLLQGIALIAFFLMVWLGRS